MTRLPLLAVQTADHLALTTTRGEGYDHLLLKRTAREWMRAEGAADAREEMRGFGGRFDVYSRDADWIVECGNSSMQKLVDAICDEEHPRFTLVPYQAIAWSDGSMRRLAAIDFVWDDGLAAELVETLIDRQDAAMKLAAHSDRARRIAEAQARKLAHSSKAS
ncbi:hypothetical protein SR39_06230 [Methylobacterium radiotolerans]|nr:hypothetical protein SR39_06230 [Methylobacterium radiotolerans]